MQSPATVRRGLKHAELSLDRNLGFIAGVIAKLVTPGSEYEPKGLILTTILGVVGALVATYLGQAIGWYRAGQGAGFIGAIVGAVLILLVGS